MWVNGEWCWVRDIRGRVCNDFDEVIDILQNDVVSNNCRDRWSWRIFEDGMFTVKELS